MQAPLDAIDRKILDLLQQDGRKGIADLAAAVGLSPSPCLRRIKRLETSGLIEGYRATLKRELVGLGFSVFLSVKLNEHANERVAQFEQTMMALPEVIACHLVSGEADYLLEVVAADLGAYQQFLVGKLLNLPVVREVRSNIAIQTLKAGAPLPLGHLQP